MNAQLSVCVIGLFLLLKFDVSSAWQNKINLSNRFWENDKVFKAFYKVWNLKLRYLSSLVWREKKN